jgi:hypothetical protein
VDEKISGMSYLDGELRGGSGVPYIARRDDVNSETESNAVHGGDHRLRASFNCRDGILEFLHGVVRVISGFVGESVAQIVAPATLKMN